MKNIKDTRKLRSQVLYLPDTHRSIIKEVSKDRTIRIILQNSIVPSSLNCINPDVHEIVDHLLCQLVNNTLDRSTIGNWRVTNDIHARNRNHHYQLILVLVGNILLAGYRKLHAPELIGRLLIYSTILQIRYLVHNETTGSILVHVKPATH